MKILIAKQFDIHDICRLFIVLLEQNYDRCY